jgi:hypothetical protein
MTRAALPDDETTARGAYRVTTPAGPSSTSPDRGPKYTPSQPSTPHC